MEIYKKSKQKTSNFKKASIQLIDHPLLSNEETYSRFSDNA